MHNNVNRYNKMVSRAGDYVDIHGRTLNAMLSDDGTFYIPLNEVKKTGFHIFPIANFNSNLVKKSMILSEFRMYMLSAAKEFMLGNSVIVFNHEDILNTIEVCRQKLLKDGVREVVTSPKGTLGRTLLQNPVEVQQEVRTVLHQTLQNKSGASTRIPDKVDHNKRDSHFRGSNSSLDLNKGKVNGDTNSFDKSNTSQNRNSSFNNNDNHHKPSALNARLKLNRNFNKKNDGYETDAKLTTPGYEKIKLQRTFQQVKVAHIDNSYDKLKYWVQLVEKEAELMEIIEKCQDAADEAQVIAPKMGDICMAMSKDDQIWYRCSVLRTTPALKVHFFDFGNDDVVREVRQLTPELRQKPALAVRTTLTSETPLTLELNEIYSVRNVKEYGDQTVCIAVEHNESKNPTPVKQPIVPVLMETFKYSSVLVNKELVKIIAFEDGKFYLRNKEHHNLLVQVLEKIKAIPKESPNKVVPNQLVFCKKEDEDMLCRAVVRDIEGNEITIQYVDFFTTTKCPLSSLYAANKQIADFPAALIESPVLKGYEAGKCNDAVKNRISREIENKTKFCVVDGMEFDLLFNSDQSSLSDTLFPIDISLRAPKAKKSPIITPYEKMIFDNMQYFEATLGTKSYVITNIGDNSDFTVTSTEDHAMEFISQCTCIDVQDEEIYAPEDDEMVLARFEGDWYRGAVVNLMDDGLVNIFFVDFGNCAAVPAEEIRKFPTDLRKIPIMGMSCQLNVPITNAIIEKFKASIKTDMEYSINVISYCSEENLYTVDIPKFTDILRKGNLL